MARHPQLPQGWNVKRTRGGKSPQEWADYLASAIYDCLRRGEGWVSALPPDAVTRLQAALDEYTDAYDTRYEEDR